MGAAGVVNNIFIILLIILGMAVFGGTVLFIMLRLKFKHKFRIKEVVQGRKVIHDTKFKEWKDADGNTWYKILKPKECLPKAPEECIEIDEKGRKVVEAYRLATGEYVYAKDTGQPIPQDITDLPELTKEQREAKAVAMKKWLDSNKAIDAYQPLTTKQRVILIEQIKKAQARRRKGWQELLLPIVGIASLVILVVCLMIFYADMAKPLLAMGDKYESVQKIQLEQLQIIQEMKNDVQVIKNQERGSKVIQEAPN